MNTTSILSFQPVSFPVPILKHDAWIHVTYPNGTDENVLVHELEKQLDNIKQFARVESIRQIKINTDISWKSLTSLGFRQGTYYLTVDPHVVLLKTIPNSAVIQDISDSISIKKLITDQFLFHQQINPYYFTSDIHTHVDRFISIVRERLNNDTCICLGVEKDNEYVGCIYAEIDGNETCMDELFVLHTERNKGFGSALIHEVCNRVTQRSISLFSTFVGVDMKVATLYERFGFEKVSVNWIYNID